MSARARMMSVGRQGTCENRRLCLRAAMHTGECAELSYKSPVCRL